MNWRKLNLSERLTAAQVALDNALNDTDILEALTNFGYDTEKLNTGKSLVNSVTELINIQKKEYGEQYNATDIVNNAWKTADRAYMKTLKIARIALRDNVTAANALQMDGIRKKSISGWLQQALIFYDNMLLDDSFINAMTSYGYTREKLESEKELVAIVRDANAVQEKEIGEAVAATRKRDAEVDKMDQWLVDFQQLARVALDDNPVWLGKLGL